MATYTENYNLILPEDGDVYDAEDYNENFSAIDTALASMEDQIAAVAETAGSAVKSIQRFMITHSIPSEETTVQTIQTVDPDKCVVIMDYLYDRSSGMAGVEYTLAADSLSVRTTGVVSGNVILQFQIVEFI